MTTGILALQGNFARHAAVLKSLGASSVEVRTAADLVRCARLIIPGGESSVFLYHLRANPDLKEALREHIQHYPTLVTCAGMILLASEVTNPAQESLGLLDITIERNGYGRQLDSFSSADLTLSEEGRKWFGYDGELSESHAKALVGTPLFIRAPRISKIHSAQVTTLASHNDTPVMVQQGSITACTFHPELDRTEQYGIHRRFLDGQDQHVFMPDSKKLEQTAHAAA